MTILSSISLHTEDSRRLREATHISRGIQTSQPQNTENLETDVKKSGDFSKNLEIDRPADKSK